MAVVQKYFDGRFACTHGVEEHLDAGVALYPCRSVEVDVGASIVGRRRDLSEDGDLCFSASPFLLASGATLEYSSDVSVCDGMEERN